MATIKIETVIIDNEQRVPPVCYKLLIDIAGHRDVCDQCYQKFYNKIDDYCITGIMLFEELLAQPEVSIID